MIGLILCCGLSASLPKTSWLAFLDLIVQHIVALISFVCVSFASVGITWWLMRKCIKAEQTDQSPKIAVYHGELQYDIACLSTEYLKRAGISDVCIVDHWKPHAIYSVGLFKLTDRYGDSALLIVKQLKQTGINTYNKEYADAIFFIERRLKQANIEVRYCRWHYDLMSRIGRRFKQAEIETCYKFWPDINSRLLQAGFQVHWKSINDATAGAQDYSSCIFLVAHKDMLSEIYNLLLCIASRARYRQQKVKIILVLMTGADYSFKTLPKIKSRYMRVTKVICKESDSPVDIRAKIFAAIR